MRDKNNNKSNSNQIFNIFKLFAASTLIFNLMVVMEIVTLAIPALAEKFALFTMIGGIASLATASIAERSLDRLEHKKENLDKNSHDHAKNQDRDIRSNRRFDKNNQTEAKGLEKYASYFSKGAVFADSIAATIGAIGFFGGIHILPLVIIGAAMGVISFIASSLTLKYGTIKGKELCAEITELEENVKSSELTSKLANHKITKDNTNDKWRNYVHNSNPEPQMAMSY